MSTKTRKRYRLNVWIDHDTMDAMRQDAELHGLPVAAILRMRLRGIDFSPSPRKAG
jgi:hypothetical protein